jgi:hypothetical protein
MERTRAGGISRAFFCGRERLLRSSLSLSWSLSPSLPLSLSTLAAVVVGCGAKTTRRVPARGRGGAAGRREGGRARARSWVCGGGGQGRRRAGRAAPPRPGGLAEERAWASLPSPPSLAISLQPTTTHPSLPPLPWKTRRYAAWTPAHAHARAFSRGLAEAASSSRALEKRGRRWLRPEAKRRSEEVGHVFFFHYIDGIAPFGKRGSCFCKHSREDKQGGVKKQGCFIESEEEAWPEGAKKQGARRRGPD